MSDLIDFYKRNWPYWVLPILIVVGAIVYVAMQDSEVPTDPFDYRGR